jgi:hypothetical protein
MAYSLRLLGRDEAVLGAAAPACEALGGASSASPSELAAEPVALLLSLEALRSNPQPRMSRRGGVRGEG